MLCGQVLAQYRHGQHTEKEQSQRLQDEVIVTRAPGRLDVMGGIGDYSGCLVLQKPTAEACHVACQRHPLAKQKVWKHIENRHKGHSKLPPLTLLAHQPAVPSLYSNNK